MTNCTNSRMALESFGPGNRFGQYSVPPGGVKSDPMEPLILTMADICERGWIFYLGENPL